MCWTHGGSRLQLAQPLALSGLRALMWSCVREVVSVCLCLSSRVRVCVCVDGSFLVLFYVTFGNTRPPVPNHFRSLCSFRYCRDLLYLHPTRALVLRFEGMDRVGEGPWSARGGGSVPLSEGLSNPGSSKAAFHVGKHGLFADGYWSPWSSPPRETE